MGGFFSKSNEINVATLNYAGITYSPFEFYSGDDEDEKELKNLSEIFREIASQRGKLPGQSQSWGIKQFDLKMQRQRYCPLYRQDVGIQRGRLMSQKQFNKKWQAEFEKNKNYVRLKDQMIRNQKKKCQEYDYLIFKTFVEYIYNYVVEKRQQHQIVHTDRKYDSFDQKKKHRQAVKEYRDFLDRHFQKKYLQHETKLAAVKQILEKKDVLLLQDVSDELINSLKNEGKITIVAPSGNSDCAILIKKDKFKKLYDQQKIMEQFERQKHQHWQLLTKESFCYRSESQAAVALVDSFLFISVHLHGSDKPKVMAKMIQHLNKLHSAFPNLHIVLGGDMNRCIKGREVGLSEQFFVQPCKPDSASQDQFFTTHKTRTWLQSQRKKADFPDKSCRDFIISTIKPKNQAEIGVVSGSILTKNRRPLTETHPFDHFLVSLTLPIENE